MEYATEVCIKALREIIKDSPTTEPEFNGSEPTYGNYDDCYEAGCEEGAAYNQWENAEIARAALKTLELD